MKARVVIPIVLAILLTAGVGVVGLILLNQESQEFRGQVMTTLRYAPDFTLTDQNGNPYGFRARDSEATVLFFGYTYCPDVCPATMVTWREAMAGLRRYRDRVRFVYVSVDPERDTPERLKEYLALYDPGIIGLTGTPEEVAAVADAYRIYVEKTPMPDGEEGYLIGHTATSYLIDSEGFIRVKFPTGTDPSVVANDVRVLLQQSR